MPHFEFFTTLGHLWIKSFERGVCGTQNQKLKRKEKRCGMEDAKEKKF